MILETNKQTNKLPGAPRPPANTHIAHTDTAQNGSKALHSPPLDFNERRKRRKERKKKPHFLERAAILSQFYILKTRSSIHLQAAAPTGHSPALSSCSRSTLRPALWVSCTTWMAGPLLSPCTYLCEPRPVLRTLSALSIVSRVRILKAFSSEEAVRLPLPSARI